MNLMIHNGIKEYPGDNATTEQFFAIVPRMFLKKKKDLK
jgi:hypothetical protein